MAEDHTTVLYVRVTLTSRNEAGHTGARARAMRYALENLSKSTESLKDLGVTSSVAIYNEAGGRERSTLYGDAEEPPLRLIVTEED